ncbi:hypothetical protein COCON_G00047660 [Conger conger]|uniref:HTH TFE/IIEalpha-type domain-containing protein n=1 Tax=Conger conger TaxID=82655 RepID=A0A9Q1DUX0_CONCO|nr:hypothetical protein COCON_G00047660 [Conger conger]
MEPELLTEVPASLKRLAKQVVRGFYGVEHALALDILIRNPCVREEDMLELLKFDRKQLRSVLNTLKADKFVKCRMRVETAADGKTTRHNYYFINYRLLVNVVKYKLDHMRRRIETDERDSTNRASFRCPCCFNTFTDLEANQLFDPLTGEEMEGGELLMGVPEANYLVTLEWLSGARDRESTSPKLMVQSPLHLQWFSHNTLLRLVVPTMKPVEANEKRGDMSRPRLTGDQAGCSILDQLEIEEEGFGFSRVECLSDREQGGLSGVATLEARLVGVMEIVVKKISGQLAVPEATSCTEINTSGSGREDENALLHHDITAGSRSSPVRFGAGRAGGRLAERLGMGGKRAGKQAGRCVSMFLSVCRLSIYIQVLLKLYLMWARSKDMQVRLIGQSKLPVGTFRCTFCQTEVEEDESALPKKDARTLVARFNEQIEPIYVLLRETEDINLSPDLLEPEPAEIPALKQSRERAAQAAGGAAGAGPGAPHQETWSTRGSSYADLYTQNVVISMDEPDQQRRQAAEGKAPRERPVWLTESTVQGAYSETDALNNAGEDAGGNRQGEGGRDSQPNENEEVMRALLIHEKRGAGGAAGGASGGAGAGPHLSAANASDSESDTSESDEDTPPRPPARSGGHREDEEEEEEDEFEEVGEEEPMVLVGGRSFSYHAVSQRPELVEQMSPQEKEAYIEMGRNLFQNIDAWEAAAAPKSRAARELNESEWNCTPGFLPQSKDMQVRLIGDWLQPPCDPWVALPPHSKSWMGFISALKNMRT